jgi:transposase
LTDAAGFPLMVNAFEGHRAETTTMLPVLTAFMAAHQLTDVTVVADAGMVSAANQQAIEHADLSFILGARYMASTSRSARPSVPWPARPRSNATGSSDSPEQRRR